MRHFLRQPRKAIMGLLEPKEKLVKKRKPLLDNDLFNRLPVSYYETELGSFYVPTHAKDDIVAKAIRTGRIFEPHVVEVAKSYAKPGTCILDIGANFGQMSVLFSRMVGNDGMVLSFEAQAYCFAILQNNLCANNCDNVRAFFGAVMEKGGNEISFPEPDLTRFRTYGSYPLNRNKSENSRENVKTLAIDDLEIDYPISFCKIDTQGSDIFGLRGMRETACKHRMPILFEYEERFQEEFETSFQDYVDFVSSIDYRFAKTIADINYLILPAVPKIYSAPTSPTPAAYLRTKDHDVIATTQPLFRQKLCKLLKTTDEVQDCTHFLRDNGYLPHSCAPKNWDLAHVIPEIGNGNILDMGSSNSYVLKNICLKKTIGKKYGIDLLNSRSNTSEINYLQGNLLQTPLPDQHLDYITCLSVVEHQVDFALFARETSRLLAPSGKLLITFDYWDPLLSIPIKAYDLTWQPLDRPLTELLISECAKNHLHLVNEVDWSTKDRVIYWGNHSPHPDVAYTFGLLVFEKEK